MLAYPRHPLVLVLTAGTIFLSSCLSSDSPSPDVHQGAEAPADTGKAERSTVAERTVESTQPLVPDTLGKLLQQRKQLDQTVFASEVDAQRHERVFVQLWDRLLRGEPWKVLTELQFDEFVFAEATPIQTTDWGLSGIQGWNLSGTRQTLDHEHYRKLADELRTAGWQIEQTEWHHTSFTLPGNGSPANSVVSFEIDAKHPQQSRRAIVRGRLRVTWSGDNGGSSAAPTIAQIDATDVQIVIQDGPPMFKQVMMVDPKRVTPSRYPRVSPLLLYDLDGNGLSEIILGGCNLLFRNLGGGRFAQEDFLQHGFKQMAEPGILADFTGDGRADFVGLSLDELRLRIFEMDSSGKYSLPSRICFDEQMHVPHVLSAGDIDADGDLDLFLGQWKPPYDKGSMPTPFWNANDGHPDYLLQNDGQGNFTDITVKAGLGAKRNRRSYSASLVDLDNDVDLDLLVVSDFSGLDLYLNNGDGAFTDVTDAWVDERHAFGMSHTLDDFDGDGRLDIYMIGMSSTTARRLQELGLNRPGYEGHRKNRMRMAYGNRMYLRRDQRYMEPAFKDQVARTGWSWGCTSADFDNDGDRDLYVANGHLSGRSTQDYCTHFWCHDVYEGSSQPNPVLSEYFDKELATQLGHQVSWNGYEHNVLFASSAGHDFHNLAYLLGVAFEFDSRAVVSDDLDGDGRMDLLVVEYDAAEFQQRLHILHNQHETTSHWIGVRLREEGDRVSPIGATVTVTADARKWIAHVITGDSFTAQHAHAVHFGLGDITTIDQLEVRWPDGQSTQIESPKLKTYHDVTRQPD